MKKLFAVLLVGCTVSAYGIGGLVSPTISANGGSGSNSYTLPIATVGQIGGVRPDGTTTSVNGSGVLSVIGSIGGSTNVSAAATLFKSTMEQVYLGNGTYQSITNWAYANTNGQVAISTRWGAITNLVAGLYALSADCTITNYTAIAAGSYGGLQILTNGVGLNSYKTLQPGVSAGFTYHGALTPAITYLPSNCVVTLAAMFYTDGSAPFGVSQATLTMLPVAGTGPQGPTGPAGSGTSYSFSTNFSVTGGTNVDVVSTPYAVTASVATNALMLNGVPSGGFIQWQDTNQFLASTGNSPFNGSAITNLNLQITASVSVPLTNGFSITNFTIADGLTNPPGYLRAVLVCITNDSCGLKTNSETPIDEFCIYISGSSRGPLFSVSADSTGTNIVFNYCGAGGANAAFVYGGTADVAIQSFSNFKFKAYYHQ